MLVLSRRRLAYHDPFQVFAILAQLPHCRPVTTVTPTGPARPKHTPVDRRVTAAKAKQDHDALFNALRTSARDRRFDSKLSAKEVVAYNVQLQELRVAILDKRLTVVLRALDKIRDKKLIGLVPPRDWRELTFFVEDAVRSGEGDPVSGHGADDPVWEDLAVEAAAAHGASGEATGALKFLLLRKLRAEDWHGALALYDRFMGQVRTVLADHAAVEKNRKRTFDVPGVPQVAPTPEQDPVLVDDLLAASLANDPQQEVAKEQDDTLLMPHSSGGQEVHFCAFAAYNALNDFPGALNASLGAIIRFQASAVANFARTLYQGDVSQSTHQIHFTRFIENVRTARSLARPKSLVKDITSLTAAHDTNRILELYANSVEASRNSGKLFATTALTPADLPLRIPEPVWVAFLTAFGTMRLHHNVESAWNELAAEGIEPSQLLWNVYLRALAMCGQMRFALTTWRQMVERNMVDAISYSTMLKAYVDFGLIDETVQLHDYLVSRRWLPSGSTGRPIPNDSRRQILNIVIDGCLKHAAGDSQSKYFQRAEVIFAEMSKKGPSPDIFTHNAFLLHHSTTGDVVGAAQRLRLISTSGLTPDAASFTIVLQGLMRAGHPTATQTTLDLMRGFNVEPTPLLFSKILAAIMGHDATGSAQAGLDLLDKMAGGGTPPDVRMYSVYLAGLFRIRSITDEVKGQYEEQARQRMTDQKINVALLSYNHILAACLESAALPTPYMITMGLLYYEEMIRRGVVPNSKGWQLVLNAVWLRGKNVHETTRVLEAMERFGVRPDVRLHGLVQKIKGQMNGTRRMSKR